MSVSEMEFQSPSPSARHRQVHVAEIYGPLTPELQKMRDDGVFQKTGRRPQPER